MIRLMDLDERSAVHAALGDRNRLAMVDDLSLSDRTFQELAKRGGLPGNLTAHHLAVLETTGLIERRVSEGDRRRRYISLRVERLEGLLALPPLPAGSVLFVCTHNSARSQFAAALWRQRTGGGSDSAGTQPSRRVHPGAVKVAREYGLDLEDVLPKGYEAIDRPHDLVISVCDRAHEAGLPFSSPTAHWSVPDPVRDGRLGAFRAAFATIAQRIDQLAATAD
jgi:protein-tyrosine-phosphatase/DNA-binding HxlR family transcriptional regulator